MAPIAIVFGVLLSALGGVLFAISETKSPTALIPAFFGVPLIIIGFIARNASDRMRMHVMHAAATIGLIGFAFPLGRIIMALIQGKELNPLALTGQLGMSALCGVFLALCVRSFIQARIERKKREALAEPKP